MLMHSTSLLSLFLPLLLTAPAIGQCDELEFPSPDVSLGARFGTSMASSGTRVIVGSRNGVAGGFGTGVAHVYEQGPGGPVQRLEPSDLPIGGEFGGAVDIDGERAIVGAERVGTPQDHGAAYIFELLAGTWTETARLLPPAGVDFFGMAVAIDDDLAVVGTFSNAYVYRRSAQGFWEHEQTLSGPSEALMFGRGVEVGGGRIVVLSPEDITSGIFSSAAYIFEESATTGAWTLTQVLFPTPLVLGNFWQDLSLDGDRLAFSGTRVLPGDGEPVVYLYEQHVVGWTLVDVISTPEAVVGFQQSFFAVDLVGDRLLVGQGGFGGLMPLTGSAYLFQNSGFGLGWELTEHFDALAPTFQQGFGVSVALTPDHALVGSPMDDDFAPSGGSLYAFRPVPEANSYCHCDPAPCANPDSFGGCALPGADHGALLSARGSASVAADDLQLLVTYASPGQPGLVFMGTSALNAAPFGNGLRCVGGSVFRFPVRSIDSFGCMQETGLVAFSSNFGIGGQIAIGSNLNFQAWFRDPAGACGSSFNLSNAVRVVFQP